MNLDKLPHTSGLTSIFISKFRQSKAAADLTDLEAIDSGYVTVEYGGLGIEKIGGGELLEEVRLAKVGRTTRFFNYRTILRGIDPVIGRYC